MRGFQNIYIYIYIYEFHHIGSYGKLLIQRKMIMEIQGFKKKKNGEEDDRQKPTWIYYLHVLPLTWHMCSEGLMLMVVPAELMIIKMPIIQAQVTAR
jgi:hypothetical protein